MNRNFPERLLAALSVMELASQLFGLCGARAKPSNGGLIVRQLIARLGGLSGARVFKIPGVRRLIKTHGPSANFTKRTALQLIGKADPNNSSASFKNHEDLFIESRPVNTKLTPEMAFSYLVEKGLFRMGAELICPACNLPSWIALDQLQQQNICDLCGGRYDGTRQLVNGEFRYRRTGVLGLEKNAQGAVAVALVLQQLSTSIRSFGHDEIYIPLGCGPDN